MEDRAALLAKVARYELPLEDTLAMLQAFGWDSSEELYCLSAAEAAAVLDRYLAGHLTGAQLRHWADLLEMRDDLGFDPRDEDLLRSLIFRLANPEINQAITPALVRDLRVSLGGTRS